MRLQFVIFGIKLSISADSDGRTDSALQGPVSGIIVSFNLQRRDVYVEDGIRIQERNEDWISGKRLYEYRNT